MITVKNISEIFSLNKNFPSIITDENADIIEVNDVCKNKLRNVQSGESLYGIFDKNTALLVKNSFIDAKAFSKVQRRKVNLFIEENEKEIQLLISPFKSEKKNFYFILLYGFSIDEYLIAYPTVDDFSLAVKYKTIIHRLEEAVPRTLIEKKNFQFDLDIEKKPIFIKEKNTYTFVNNSFLNYVRLTEEEVKTKTDTEIFEKQIAAKLLLAQNISMQTKNIAVVESIDFTPEDLQQKNRIVIYPVFDYNNDVAALVNFGTIDAKLNEERIKKEIVFGKKVEKKKEVKTAENIFNENKIAAIVFNTNNFVITAANKKAEELYGYSADELLQKEITDLCVPEDLQKFLLPDNENEKVEFKHIKKDGTVIEVLMQSKLSEDGKSKTGFITLKEKSKDISGTEKVEETVTAGDAVIEKDDDETVNITEDKKTTEEPKTETAPIIKTKETSPFLSSLFHELLTPVNVILGFVQEIIDSIDKPTEEQQESAKIIKTNQQLLLQTMNTAVQYSQLIEGKIKFKAEDFLLNNYLLDLKDSVSRVAEKENKEIEFADLTEEIKLKNDRQKLLAAISYFIKFAVKLTESKKIKVLIIKNQNNISVSIKETGNGINKKLADDLFEIYNSENPFEKKNYGISPVAIKLAKKLNEMVNAKVQSNSANEDTAIEITFPPEVTEYSAEKTIAEKPEDKKTPFEKEKSAESLTDTNGNEIKVVDEITSAEVDNVIAKDIEDEEEIKTDEITTQEAVKEEDLAKQTKNVLSELSCLLIEDSVDAQLLFEMQMKDFKLLKIVSGLTDALPLIKKYKFDLIFVDINLKGQYNGLDALRIIKQFENYKNIPIIAVTAYPFLGDKEKFMNAGFTDYFKKPLLKEQLLNSIQKIFA